MKTAGSAPRGTQGEEQAARWVRQMFGRVAPRYDLLNHLFSMNLDRYWRRRAVRRLAPLLSPAGARVVDLCCGSGDLTLALERAGRALVFGSDFCHPMLIAARGKFRNGSVRAPLFEADALRLPLADATLDLVTAAFGFRNLTNYRRGLAEMRRVLRPGGAAAILEFSTPPNRAFRACYHFYSHQVMPRAASWISGETEGYRYLPESVRKFPAAEELARAMSDAGFRDVAFERMSLGIVALHTGRAG